MTNPLYIYDLETYLHIFLFTGKFEGDPNIYTFEISRRRNDREHLLAHLSWLQARGIEMVGFNSFQFDWPIVDELLQNPFTFTQQTGYLAAQRIFQQQYGQNPHAIKLQDRIIPQIDLVKINHFDNVNRRTSLKALQVAMRSESVEDLPFPVDAELTDEQMDLLRSYNVHDVTETEKFLRRNKEAIRIRRELLENGVLTGDVLNFSDVKIGEQYLIKRIGRNKCYSGSKPKQTFRTSVGFDEIILPKIEFKTEPYQEVLDWFRKQTIYINQSKDKSKKIPTPKLNTKLADIDFVFGVGGVHASVENQVFESTATHVIKDIDVSGMYVAVAVANGFYPEHLGQDFVSVYRQLQKDRSSYPRGSTMNAVLKLAGNGVYGKSNDLYSCFYDPKYTYSVTVNGQLQLLQLVEHLSLIPGLKIIQANTDGITCSFPRNVEQFFQLWKSEWECVTGLKLEEVEYKKMWIRDVNSYIALKNDGSVKLKGAYWYPKSEEDYNSLTWNKDFSNLCVQKAVEQVLIHGASVEDALLCNTNMFDFMARAKTPAGAKIYIGEREMLKTVRYYVSTAGEKMVKITQAKAEGWKRKPKVSEEEYQKVLSEIPEGAWDPRIHTKNKSRYADTETGIEAAYKVRECNHVKSFNWNDVDYDYYIEEVKKLLIGVQPC